MRAMWGKHQGETGEGTRTLCVGSRATRRLVLGKEKQEGRETHS